MELTDLGVLRDLDALLQTGSVTGAARRVGLSTPAMSHALARIREQLGDPVLVRAGRGMVLTPRAEALKPRIHALLAEARQLLEPDRTFVAGELRRTFAILCTDYVLSTLGCAIDARVRREAPHAGLRFVANTPDDGALLRSGDADLAVGIYGELPPEVRTRRLLTDRFVCVVREGHPTVGDRISLEEYVGLEHVQIAPRGTPGGYVDDELRARGLERRVTRAFPYFLIALHVVAETDAVLTVSERAASAVAERLGLRLLEPPLALDPYALSLAWHPRHDSDDAHRWLRDVFVHAASEAAGDAHPNARTRLAR